MAAHRIWSSSFRCQIDNLWWWTGRAPVCPAHGCAAGSLTSDTRCPLKSSHLRIHGHVFTTSYCEKSRNQPHKCDLQLSKSSLHSCSSIGYLVRSISQATVEVILEAARNNMSTSKTTHCILEDLWKCLNDLVKKQEITLGSVTDDWTLHNCPAVSFSCDAWLVYIHKTGLNFVSAILSANILCSYRTAC